ncbi:isoflavone reductase family protein-like protein CipA [Clohesyomyces aquaticus]|uniref:Isoflavone reductase family protein-like protein CipA n=1 Tax=Clohesyomyces aquaticus TaxID=1231657 RepID=A0A1Y1YFF5_9PLEO|nr:isoflavone reductase family protein-like protein CipA [Clohesyomyces aquaticus]
MSSEIKNVVIIGAGGNLGPSILNAFLKESSFNVTVLSREGSQSTFPSGVKVVRADYNSPDSLATAFQGQDAVISLVGGMALGDQSKLIDGAIKAGVKRFIPSEFGSNTVDPRVLAIVPLFAAKTGAVNYLKSKEKEISWTSVITGPFLDWGLKVGFLGFDLSSKTVTLIDEGKGKFTSTNLHQIGLALIKALEKSSETKNTYIFVGSLTTSQAEILPVIEKVSAQKWTVEHVTSKELIQTGGEKLQKNDFSGIADLIKGAAFGGDSLGDSRPAGLWNEKLGLKEESLEETVKAVLGGKLVGEN